MFLLNKRIQFFLYIFFIISVQLNAQQKVLTLSQLVDAAKSHLPFLQQDQSLIKSAEAFVKDTRNEVYLPDMHVNDQINLGTTNSLVGSFLPIGVNPAVVGGLRGDNNSQLATGNFAVLYSQYELYDFGLKKARINNATSFLNVQKSGLQKDVYSVETEICKLYFNLLKYQFKLSTDSENVKHYNEIYSVIKALALSGIKPGSDTALAKAELSKAKINYNQSFGSILSIKQQLAYYTGIPASNVTIDTLALQSFNINDMEPNNMAADTINHPFIDYINKQKQIFVTNQSVISKSYMPKLFVAGSAWARGSSIQYNDNYKALSEGLGYQRFNYMVGVGVTYDLFNGIKRRDKLAVNRYQTQAVDDALRQEKLVLSNASLQADNALITYSSNLRELPNQMESAVEVFNQTLAQYKAGIINLIDLTNAAFVLYRSQTDYIEALSSWYLAKVDKASATGNIDSFIQLIK